jgi:hypothetical protein
MPHIIASKDMPQTYYTGHDWSENESEAATYATPALAQNIIAKHNMKAEVVQIGTNDLDDRGPDGDSSDQD